MSAPDDLDPLLEDQAADAPPDLAERVLARLKPELQDVRLDRLLDRVEVDDPPAGLAQGVMRAVRPALDTTPVPLPPVQGHWQARRRGAKRLPTVTGA